MSGWVGRSAIIVAMALIGSVCGPATAEPSSAGQVVADGVMTLTRGTQWSLARTIPVNFPTFHPQGMVKIGDVFYVSSVEITRSTTKFDQPKDGYDRDTGEGVGHLFKIDAKGDLLADVRLGEGAVYHPGGIDYDGTRIFVPVAEYRPNSQAIVYAVDPQTMQAKELFRYKDHLGGIVHDTERNTLNAVSWGSRRFYAFALSGDGRVVNASHAPEQLRKANPAHYIDYQDCHYLHASEMLCGGLTSYQMKKDGPKFGLGGIEIVDLVSGRPVFQVPLQLWTESGLPMTQNPFWIEPTDDGLRAYFMPEDDRSTIYVYEAATK